jgi:hypothetical protein
MEGTKPANHTTKEPNLPTIQQKSQPTNQPNKQKTAGKPTPKN